MGDHDGALFAQVFLEHHGIKGMHWGIRRRTPEERAARESAKADRNYVDHVSKIHTYISIHNEAADRANKQDIERINNKPEWKAEGEKGTFLNPDHPKTQEYYKEHEDAYLKHVNDVINERGLRTNPSGTKALEVVHDPSTLFGWNYRQNHVLHGLYDLADMKPTPKLEVDGKGCLTKIHPMDAVEHGVLATAFIMHHGIKGMHWGVRKGPVQRTAVSAETGHNRSGKAVVKTSGGTGHPAHEDSVAARMIQQKLKESGSHALSNAELNQLLTRTDLERRLSQSTSKKSTSKQVEEFLRSPEGKTTIKVAKSAANSPKVRRVAATVATTAAMR